MYNIHYDIIRNTVKTRREMKIADAVYTSNLESSARDT
jgi:hypothetical protein